MRKVLLMGCIICVGLMCGCSRRSESVSATQAEVVTSPPVEVTTAPDEPETRETEPDERVEVDGKIRSYLTGEMTDVKKANRRPLAVMMSNDKASLPQYGINRAGVVYEAPVEGDMNRYMAIIEDYDDLERIGSVRSCRTYYIYFAREFNAIYAHYGQSTFAKPYLINIDDINGVDGIGTVAFYRSRDKNAPHNAYTSFDRIQQAIETLGFSQEYDETYEGHYLFAKKDSPTVLTQENAVDAYKVAPGYRMNKPYFTYNEEDGLYYRYQYGAAHNGDEGQIKVKNIIIQYCQSGYYASTAYLNINVQTSEWGYFITNGKAIPIHWEKDGEFGPTHYYDSEDKEIVLNPGKTWVCIVSTKDVDMTEIYGKE